MCDALGGGGSMGPSGNDDADWMRVLRLVHLSREIDRAEVEHLTPPAKVKLQLSAVGHELPQILLALEMVHPHDAASAYYRSRPFVLASGLTLREAFAGALARSGSLTEGRDTGIMFNLRRRTGATVLPTSGDVGAQYSVAAGWAQAIRYHRRELGDATWDGAIAVAMGGDGSVSTNGFWAALNIVTTLELPLVLYVEDNGYSISVPSSLQTPGGNIAANLASFGNLKVLDADGSDPEEALSSIREAVGRARAGLGPSLLRMRVPRLAGHAYRDDQSYKDAAERESEAARDPLVHLEAFLSRRGVPPSVLENVRLQAREEVLEALAAAEGSPEPDPAGALDHMFDAALGVDRDSGGDALPQGPRINLVDAVRRTLESELGRDRRIVVFGEDVGRKGGVHGATRDLQSRFGPERVFDTSLSEEGIVGRATGMALAGLRPVPEIQFRKYADPAHEQIVDLGTLRWRTAGRFGAPVVLRMPVGFGKRGGDPFHAVCAEAIFAHNLGWRIAFPSNAEDAVGLLRTALRSNDPTLFLEHRALLDVVRARRPYPGDGYALPFGVAATVVPGDDLTVIAWGEMVHRCREAAAGFPGRIDLLDLRTLAPWDREAVLRSVRRTGRALVVHEDTRTVGFAAEILATIGGEAFAQLDAPLARLTTPDCPVPYNLALMDSLIPDVQRIGRAMAEILEY